MELIGAELVWNDCAGIIVETEAYSVRDDEACHTFMRPSAREFVGAHDAGAAYVYLNYGMHWLLNVLVKNGGEDGFVLIRALEPTRGLDLMRARRRKEAGPAAVLCSGPGRLAQALNVTRADHGIDLCLDPERHFVRRKSEVAVESDVRIGISRAAHLEWRYLLAGSRFVSVKKRLLEKQKVSPEEPG
jgi:DNA-3-methyladenine glycosylase